MTDSNMQTSITSESVEGVNDEINPLQSEAEMQQLVPNSNYQGLLKISTTANSTECDSVFIEEETENRCKSEHLIKKILDKNCKRNSDIDLDSVCDLLITDNIHSNPGQNLMLSEVVKIEKDSIEDTSAEYIDSLVTIGFQIPSNMEMCTTANELFIDEEKSSQEYDKFHTELDTKWSTTAESMDNASEAELEIIYERCLTARLQEESNACLEMQRHAEILAMCSAFEQNIGRTEEGRAIDVKVVKEQTAELITGETKISEVQDSTSCLADYTTFGESMLTQPLSVDIDDDYDTRNINDTSASNGNLKLSNKKSTSCGTIGGSKSNSLPRKIKTNGSLVSPSRNRISQDGSVRSRSTDQIFERNDRNSSISLLYSYKHPAEANKRNQKPVSRSTEFLPEVERVSHPCASLSKCVNLDLTEMIKSLRNKADEIDVIKDSKQLNIYDRREYCNSRGLLESNRNSEHSVEKTVSNKSDLVLTNLDNLPELDNDVNDTHLSSSFSETFDLLNISPPIITSKHTVDLLGSTFDSGYESIESPSRFCLARPFRTRSAFARLNSSTTSELNDIVDDVFVSVPKSCSSGSRNNDVMLGIPFSETEMETASNGPGGIQLPDLVSRDTFLVDSQKCEERKQAIIGTLGCMSESQSRFRSSAFSHSSSSRKETTSKMELEWKILPSEPNGEFTDVRFEEEELESIRQKQMALLLQAVKERRRIQFEISRERNELEERERQHEETQLLLSTTGSSSEVSDILTLLHLERRALNTQHKLFEDLKLHLLELESRRYEEEEFLQLKLSQQHLQLMKKIRHEPVMQTTPVSFNSEEQNFREARRLCREEREHRSCTSIMEGPTNENNTSSGIMPSNRRSNAYSSSTKPDPSVKSSDRNKLLMKYLTLGSIDKDPKRDDPSQRSSSFSVAPSRLQSAAADNHGTTAAAFTAAARPSQGDSSRLHSFDSSFSIASEMASDADLLSPLNSTKFPRNCGSEGKQQNSHPPVSQNSADLRQHIELMGHVLNYRSQVQISPSACRGFISKLGGRFRSWQRRWFVLDHEKGTVAYYRDRSETRARRTIVFTLIQDVFVDHLRSVKSPNPSCTFCLKTADRNYFLMTSTGESMRIWIDVLITGAKR